MSKREPLSVTYGIGLPEFDGEGRVIAAEYEEFTLVTVYTPNSQRDLVRIDYRLSLIHIWTVPAALRALVPWSVLCCPPWPLEHWGYIGTQNPF